MDLFIEYYNTIYSSVYNRIDEFIPLGDLHDLIGIYFFDIMDNYKRDKLLEDYSVYYILKTTPYIQDKDIYDHIRDVCNYIIDDFFISLEEDCIMDLDYLETCYCDMMSCYGHYGVDNHLIEYIKNIY